MDEPEASFSFVLCVYNINKHGSKMIVEIIRWIGQVVMVISCASVILLDV